MHLLLQLNKRLFFKKHVAAEIWEYKLKVQQEFVWKLTVANDELLAVLPTRM